MLPPNSFNTAAQHAGNAPMWSGSTTCCATTWAVAFMSAQEASCDSRTMVEKPVRNSAFCISCTMPERLALITSRSMASTSTPEKRPPSTLTLLRHDEVLPRVDARNLARIDHGRAVELVEDRRTGEVKPGVDTLALVHRTVETGAVETYLSRLPQRVFEPRAGACELRHLDVRHEADAAHAVGDDFDRLLG